MYFNGSNRPETTDIEQVDDLAVILKSLGNKRISVKSSTTSPRQHAGVFIWLIINSLRADAELLGDLREMNWLVGKRLFDNWIIFVLIVVVDCVYCISVTEIKLRLNFLNGIFLIHYRIQLTTGTYFVGNFSCGATIYLKSTSGCD